MVQSSDKIFQEKLYYVEFTNHLASMAESVFKGISNSLTTLKEGNTFRVNGTKEELLSFSINLLLLAATNCNTISRVYFEIIALELQEKYFKEL